MHGLFRASAAASAAQAAANPLCCARAGGTGSDEPLHRARDVVRGCALGATPGGPGPGPGRGAENAAGQRLGPFPGSADAAVGASTLFGERPERQSMDKILELMQTAR